MQGQHHIIRVMSCEISVVWDIGGCGDIHCEEGVEK